VEKRTGILSLRNPFIGKAASIFCFLGGLSILATNLHPSQVQEFWIYSYFRWLFLIITLAATIYFLISLRITLFLKINTFFVLALLFNTLLLECVFQFFPILVPTKLIRLLPPDLREGVAIQRGLMTSQTIVGENMLYSKNTAKFNKTSNPWLKVDRDGYRNPSRPDKDINLVVFGDSVIFADEVRKDLAEKFSDIGVPAYNLAMGGYSPFHYLDSYRKFVISRNLFHKKILIFFSTANDFTDSTRYMNIKKGGGDYRAYLGQGSNEISSILDHLPLFIPAILTRTPSFLRAEVTSFRRFISGLLGPKGAIQLPYARYEATAAELEIFDIKPNS